MKCEAFIFDLDGVLVDSAKFHYLAWKAIADKLEINFTLKDNERLKGVSRRESLEILLSLKPLNITEADKCKLMEEKNALYLEYIMKMTEHDILPGARDFLCEARNRGLKISLASASKNASLILKQVKIIELFDAIIDGNMTSRTKPDPEVFIKAADALKSPYEHCVVFEDAEAGIEAACRAGMLPVAITEELFQKAKLQYKNLAECKIDDVLRAVGAIF